MKRQNIERRLLITSLVSFALVSVSFLVMIPSPGAETPRWRQVAAGLLFWLPLAAGIAAQMRLNNRCKMRRNQEQWEKQQGRIGLVSFGVNRYGRIADMVMVPSFIGLVLSLWLTHSTGTVCYIFLCLTFFSVSAHCILNPGK